MVADYLYFSGWNNIEIVDLRENNGDEEHQDNTGLAGFMKWVGCGAHDPLWVVRGVNSSERGELIGPVMMTGFLIPSARMLFTPWEYSPSEFPGHMTYCGSAIDTINKFDLVNPCSMPGTLQQHLGPIPAFQQTSIPVGSSWNLQKPGHPWALAQDIRPILIPLLGSLASLSLAILMMIGRLIQVSHTLVIATTDPRHKVAATGYSLHSSHVQVRGLH